MKDYMKDYIRNINDEWLTLEYAVYPIIKYLKPNSNIWCPFDKHNSAFVTVLKNVGHKVIFSHIDEGNDFFTTSPPDKCDLIISNPPFSLRKQVINHLFNINKPFMMLMPLVSIALKDFKEKLNNLQLLIFDKRIKYKAQNQVINKNPPSETCYFCYNVLPKQMIYEELKVEGQLELWK